MRRSVRAAVMMMVMALVAPAVARAQAIELRGTVRESATHQPISGAVVTLFDSSTKVLGRMLTGQSGQYHVPMANAVRHIRVQRLGYRPMDLRAPPPADGLETLDVEMVTLPSLLDPVRVVVDKRCPIRDDGERAQSLLQQARSGLLSVVVARDSNPGTIVVLNYQRRVEAKNDQVIEQAVAIDSAVRTAISFRSARSSADLVRLGFQNAAGRGETYGPDADVLLDDDFAAGYCFRIAAPDTARPNQIGLGFAAADRRRGRVDIDGTLWMDTVGRRLVDIEYRYIGLGASDAMHPGGHTYFREMTNGIVLIDRWFIQTPAVELGRYSRYRNVVGGGEVVRASWPDGVTWHAGLGTLRLHTVTTDSSPATGAIVGLYNTTYRGIVDSAGSVVFTNLLPGPYLVVAADRRLPEINLIPKEKPVTVVAARDSTVTMTTTVQTLTQFTLARCKTDRRLLGRSVLLLGSVTDPGGAAVGDADVTYGQLGRDPIYRLKTGDDGLFAVCLDAAHKVGAAEIHVRGPDRYEGQVVNDLHDELTPMRIRLARVFRGGEKPVTVHGIAYDSLHGTTLAGAQIGVNGIARTVLSDSTGAFVFDSLVAGRYTFVMQHDVLDAIGVGTVSGRAEVTDGKDTVRISVPSFTVIWRAICAGSPAKADSGIIVGAVHRANRPGGQRNVAINGTWVDDDSASQISHHGHIDAVTDSLGAYAMCGVPRTAALRMRASTDSASTGIIDLPALGKERVVRRDFLLGAVADTDSTSRGTVAGQVLRDSTPVANARVLTEGVPEVRTGNDGRFIVHSVPVGTRQIEARSIGFQPVTSIVDVVARDTQHVVLRFDKIIILDSVHVTAQASARRSLVLGFIERRKSAVDAYFRDSTTIGSFDTVIGAFSNMAAVTPQSTRGGGVDFFIAGCQTPAMVIIDRQVIDHEVLPSILGTMRPQDIAAIEVYKESPPAELRPPPKTRCDEPTVVIWTKRGWP